MWRELVSVLSESIEYICLPFSTYALGIAAFLSHSQKASRYEKIDAVQLHKHEKAKV
jgi:hypothetical protein